MSKKHADIVKVEHISESYHRIIFNPMTYAIPEGVLEDYSIRTIAESEKVTYVNALLAPGGIIEVSVNTTSKGHKKEMKKVIKDLKKLLRSFERATALEEPQPSTADDSEQIAK